MPYVATPIGATAAGSPVYRVVTDGMQVVHVVVPRRQSGAAAADASITHALAALARRPKPVR